MRKACSLFARFGVAAACLAYAVTGVDLKLVGQAIVDYPPQSLCLALGISVIFFAGMGLRLAVLVRHGVTPAQGFIASLIGFGMNYVLPARLGEVTKAVYLCRKQHVPPASATGAIVAERLLDMMALLAIAGLCAASGGIATGAWMLAMATAGAVALIVLCACRPALLERLIAILPLAPLRTFLCETMLSLGQFTKRGRLAAPGAYTLLIWACTLAHVFVVLNGLMGLDLAPIPVLIIFVTITLGGIIPAAPGGLGVFEGAVVVALGWYGIDKSTALATALTYRIVITLLPTLAALLLVAASGLRPSLSAPKNQLHDFARGDIHEQEDRP